MSSKDLKQFLKKVEDLNDMVRSLDKFPDRKGNLAACKNHEEVVELAKSWGYEIGRRWGESS